MSDLTYHTYRIRFTDGLDCEIEATDDTLIETGAILALEGQGIYRDRSEISESGLKLADGLTLIKAHRDGSRRLSFYGAQFAVNSAGLILWAADWSIIEDLTAAGLITRHFYQHLYGDTSYALSV